MDIFELEEAIQQHFTTKVKVKESIVGNARHISVLRGNGKPIITMTCEHNVVRVAIRIKIKYSVALSLQILINDYLKCK